MLGPEFKRTLRAAQAGNETAFIRLWRDANPAMIRYLRVVGLDDPYDGACEGWITVVRGLPGFAGDETAWRVWLLACTRMRAEDGALRRAWGSVTALSGRQADRTDPPDEWLDLDDLEDDDDELHNRGLNHTIAAIRRLPMGQGEVLMLRLGVGLPVSAVADVVGTDAVAIRRSEARGLERLGVDRELLTWSLAAPASAAELADERVVSGAYRSLPRPARARVGPGTRVVALAPVAGSRPYVASRRDRPARAAGVVGLSRTAMIGAVAVSASVMSLGGISAAAYVGVLPDPIQSILHDALGAPAPGSERPGDGSGNGSGHGSGGTDPGVPGQGGQGGQGGAGVKGPKSAQPGSSPTVKEHPVTPGKSKTGADHTAVPPSSTHAPATGRPTKTSTKAPAKPPTNTHSAGKPSASQVEPTATATATDPSAAETARGTGSGSKPTAPSKGPPSPKKGG